MKSKVLTPKYSEQILIDAMLEKFLEKFEEQKNTKKAIISSYKKYLFLELRKRYAIIRKVFKEINDINLSFKFLSVWVDWNTYHVDDDEYAAKELLKSKFIFVAGLENEHDCLCKFGRTTIDLNTCFPKAWLHLSEEQLTQTLQDSIIVNSTPKLVESIKQKLNKKELDYLKKNGLL